MGTAMLQRISRFGMGSHMLLIEQGRHLQLPRHRRVCKLCHAGALGDERHLLLECPALADIRTHFSQRIAHCSGIMARLVWFRDQPLVSRFQVHDSLPWYGVGPLRHKRYSIHLALLAATDQSITFLASSLRRLSQMSPI